MVFTWHVYFGENGGQFVLVLHPRECPCGVLPRLCLKVCAAWQALAASLALITGYLGAVVSSGKYLGQWVVRLSGDSPGEAIHQSLDSRLEC